MVRMEALLLSLLIALAYFQPIGFAKQEQVNQEQVQDNESMIAQMELLQALADIEDDHYEQVENSEEGADE